MFYPDFNRAFEIYTDASLVGIGAVLMQRDCKSDQLKLICCASRPFRGGEVNYYTTKKEFLALVWALRKFENLVLGKKIIINTDHQALTFLLTQKHVNPMLARWVETLLEFDLEIRHVPGPENDAADALSRQYEKWKVDRHRDPVQADVSSA